MQRIRIIRPSATANITYRTLQSNTEYNSESEGAQEQTNKFHGHESIRTQGNDCNANEERRINGGSSLLKQYPDVRIAETKKISPTPAGRISTSINIKLLIKHTQEFHHAS